MLTEFPAKIIEYCQIQTVTFGFCNLTVKSPVLMPPRNTTQTKSNSSDLHERLWRARRLIDECYDLPLDLSEISREACLSRYHFLRLFREAFETTPHQYLIQRRIEKAKELLRFCNLSVTDVCFEVGFQGLGSFSSLFRKWVCAAPGS